MNTRRKPFITRAVRTLAILLSLPLIVQFIITKWQQISSPRKPLLGTGAPAPPKQPEQDSNSTIWDILKSDEDLSRFADIIEMSPNIVQGLSVPQARFTVYAPVNEAFEQVYFPPDLPDFYWMYLAAIHMSPGPISADDLHSSATIPTLIDADIYDTYKQRMSVQNSGGKVTLNHMAEYLRPEKRGQAAINGFVHRIGGVLDVPNSTAHAIRTRPELSQFNDGLSRTGLSQDVYDTNAHLGQTIFAPTNAAFNRLGTKATRFLFSKWGKPYLRVLLKCHVISNQTLFSDMYWPHGGAEQIDFRRLDSAPGSGVSHQIHLPTMHTNLNLTAVIRQSQGGWHLKVAPSGAVDTSGHEKKITPVVLADIVTMDGVVHMIDSLLLPPVPPQLGKEKMTSPTWSWLTKPFRGGGIDVEELIERLGPLIGE